MRKHVCVSLESELVVEVKARGFKLSPLLNTLLSDWLRVNSLGVPVVQANPDHAPDVKLEV
jgi:hypothetical protein